MTVVVEMEADEKSDESECSDGGGRVESGVKRVNCVNKRWQNKRIK